MRAPSLRLVIGGGALAVAVAAVGLAAASRGTDDEAADETAPRPQAEVQRARAVPSGLPASNLRILTATETRRLLRYATEVHACLTRNGVEAIGPTTRSKSITLEAVESVGVDRLVALMSSCADLGPPPSPASLQAVDARTVALTLPKQCLLDPKITAR